MRKALLLSDNIKRVAVILLFSLLFHCDLIAAPVTKNAPASKPPATAREFFNAGTKNFSTTNLSEAEALFKAALAKQDETLQPQALYNLGHVRFAQGIEEFKKTPPPNLTKDRSNRALDSAENAIKSAEEALAAENDIQKMVDAYQRGRGVRKELRSAYAAVSLAMEIGGRTLQKWRRARDDFQSAAELNPSDTNAVHNVSVVEQSIAALVDSLRVMQMSGTGAPEKKSKLDELLSQLKGKIPKDRMPPGAPGNDGEEGEGEKGDKDGKGKDGDEDKDGLPLEKLRGTAEGPSRDGQERERMLTSEEAGNLLNGFKLGGDKRLPMGQGEKGVPLDRKLRDW